MSDEMIATIRKDIERCKSQTEIDGSEDLFAALVAKYDGVFPGFSKSIPRNGKATSLGLEFDFRPELNAVREKLEVQLLIASESDSLYKFKTMYADDLKRLEPIVNGTDKDVSESEKLKLYKEVTAKYYPYVPKLGEGLYQFFAGTGFFDEVSGSGLDHNIAQIYYKMKAYQGLGFPGLAESTKANSGPVINLTNNNENRNFNENQNTIAISFDEARKKIGEMTSLPYEDIEEIQSKINKLEEIVNLKDSRSKKWSMAKGIIKWIADKGVDVGIALLPLLLNI